MWNVINITFVMTPNFNPYAPLFIKVTQPFHIIKGATLIMIVLR